MSRHCIVLWSLTPRHPRIFRHQEAELRQAMNVCLRTFKQNVIDHFEHHGNINCAWVAYATLEQVQKANGFLCFQHSCFVAWAAFVGCTTTNVQQCLTAWNPNSTCTCVTLTKNEKWKASSGSLNFPSSFFDGFQMPTADIQSNESLKVQVLLGQVWGGLLFQMESTQNSKNIFEILFIMALEMESEAHFWTIRSSLGKARVHYLLKKLLMEKKRKKDFLKTLREKVLPELHHWHLLPPGIKNQHGGFIYRELCQKYSK